jgi:hypothetical protein
MTKYVAGTLGMISDVNRPKTWMQDGASTKK